MTGRLLEAARLGRYHERRRVLDALDGFAYMAAISPNGEITENTLAALRAEITRLTDTCKEDS